LLPQDGTTEPKISSEILTTHKANGQLLGKDQETFCCVIVRWKRDAFGDFTSKNNIKEKKTMYQFLYFPLSGEQYVLVYPYARINLLLRNYFLHLLVCTSLYSLDIYVEVLIKITCVWFYQGCLRCGLVRF